LWQKREETGETRDIGIMYGGSLRGTPAAADPADMDTGRHLGQDRSVAGRVESAVRAAITPGDVLATPSGRGQFTVARYTTDSLVLLLDEKGAWTPLAWRALEEIPDFLRGRDCVLIGSVYSTESRQGSLDKHLKRYLKRATAGWVAVVLGNQQ
jgi:hypothetical protein